jgi:tetratricopeptide (TPR) repeat protein
MRKSNRSEQYQMIRTQSQGLAVVILLLTANLAEARYLSPSDIYETSSLEASSSAPSRSQAAAVNQLQPNGASARSEANANADSSWLGSTVARAKSAAKDLVARFYPGSSSNAPGASNQSIARNNASTNDSSLDSSAGVLQSPAVTGASASNAKNSSDINSGSTATANSAASTAASSNMATKPSAGAANVNQNGALEFASGSAIPSLDLPAEKTIHASDYFLEGKYKRLFANRVLAALPSPDFVSDKIVKSWLAKKVVKIDKSLAPKLPVVTVDTAATKSLIPKMSAQLAPMSEVKLEKYIPLTENESRFLSALLMREDGKCASALPLLYSLTASKEWQAEADYYLGQCSRKLGLISDAFDHQRRVLDSKDTFYSPLVLRELGSDVPYESIESVGASLSNYIQGHEKSLDEKSLSNVAYIIAKYAASLEKHKTALEWAPKVSATNAKYPEAQFVLGNALYQSGKAKEAIAVLSKALDKMIEQKLRPEFQALIALDLGRMLFQEQSFKEARTRFLNVAKDHPLWLQSLVEMGWTQLQIGDYEGAVGNMYSVHSPYFAPIYKPESFVIRTVGYLNLCQYPDAYKTLSILEAEYRPALDKMTNYINTVGSRSAYYEAVRKFLLMPPHKEGEKRKDHWKMDFDGLPLPVIREMARHRDFTNLQKALNRLIDEKPLYEKLSSEVDQHAREVDAKLVAAKSKIQKLKSQLASIAKNPQLGASKKVWQTELDQETSGLSAKYFRQALLKDIKIEMVAFKKLGLKAADERNAKIHVGLDRVLSNRLLRMKTELARVLENNEFLRYEVFAGSGENIRYQVAGGEKGNRIPANMLPQSKSLQWNFDGEYWEDEIGHYRSSLKSNCPDSKASSHASTGGSQ